MTKFVSYLRVSTHRQGYSGLGIDAQRAAIDAYLRGSGGQVIEELVEVESGTKRDRPILVQSIALCKRERAILLIAKLDRLARNVAFVSSLMESGVEFIAVDAPFANRLMLHIMAAFAEHERDQISARTKAALASAKLRGVELGRNGKLLARKNRESAIAAANLHRELVDRAERDGCCTLAQYASYLNDRGSLTREGHQWSPPTVRRLISRLREPAV